EHVPDPAGVVREAKRVLRPNGLAFASSPDAQRWVWDDYTHRRPFTKKAYRLLFEDQGFAIERLGYETVIPGTSIVSQRTARNRRPVAFQALGHLRFLRRNVWILARN
ncbi:MAG: class I SAM-dependent methyltransferase, partial [Chloroflexi bacterium]|nr:class I SAM-dependent methyltransferase [Chloroflexota bacterium]